MRLAIDCRGLRTSPTGIPNFVVTAINGIALQRPNWELFLLANSPFNADLERKLIKRNNITIVIEPLKGLPNIGIVWYSTKINRIINKIKPDLFWAPAFLLPPFIPSSIRTLVTVHDMVFKQHKETMAGMNKLIFNLLHDQSVKKADMLWVNSEYTRKGVEHFFPKRTSVNIFSGFFIDTDLFRKIEYPSAEQQALLDKYKLGQKFLLFVGTLEPRKNLSFLLSLMPQLSKKGYSLLIIGARGWGETNVRNIIETDGFPKESVRFAGFVSTEELIMIYNIASVYVSTSHNEGFGMPQLEAMACGCPVVSPHNSAMVEVVSGAGETIKGWDIDNWVQTIDKVYAERHHYIEKGFRRVEEYKRDYVIKNLIGYIENNMSLI